MAERVGDGVWLLDLGLAFPLGSNGYLVDDGEVTVVDPGLPVNRPGLEAELADAGYDLADVDRVLVTHYDLEHAGGLRAFAGAGDRPVYIGAADLAIARGENDANRSHHKGLYHRVVRRLLGLPGGPTYHAVRDGDRIGGFTAYHTPGHNPGHTVYVHESGVAFLGDLVFEREGRLSRSFWLDSYDMREVTESIRDLVARVEPFDVAAVGHGDPVRPDGYEALAACAEDL